MADVVDMDLDLMETEANTLDALVEPVDLPNEPFSSPQDANSPDDGASIRPEAIFLYGLNEMSTKDIKAYCSDVGELVKIEWINDASCNLVFPDADAALKAGQALLLDDIDTPLTHTILRKTKPYQKDDGRTFDQLHIRIATLADVKERGARERSRYYLLYGTEESEIDNYMRDTGLSNGATGERRNIESRLGQRREPMNARQPRASRESRGRVSDRHQDQVSVFDRLGQRVSPRRSNYDNDRYRSRRPRSRGRSQSPIRQSRSPQPENPDTTDDTTDDTIDIPESLKGRLGPRRE